MCGIAGVYYFKQQPVNLFLLEKMGEAMAHRGPDFRDKWVNRQSDLGFVHNRLSIVDHSNEANQPMHYAEGRYTIVYNGEIYNYKELRSNLALKGYVFTTDSDTEVILAMYACYGELCLSMLDGMFAFALWDEKEQALFCARDRFGEKPFYYYADQEKLVFASEMKGLKAFGVDLAMDNEMLFNYMIHNKSYNPLNRTQSFYQKIKSLAPAHVLVCRDHKIIELHKYWTLNTEVDHSLSLDQASLRFKELMYDSVSARIKTDVKYGSSLSGGIDSSVLFSIIEENSLVDNRRQNTFSAFFPGFVKDEESFVKRLLANKYSVDSFSTFPDASKLVASLDKMLYYQEFPVEGPSVFAQYEVMKLAKSERIKVIIDGQGADEIMGGYNIFHKYLFQQKFQHQKLSQFFSDKKSFQKNYTESINFNFKFYLEIISDTFSDEIKKRKTRFSFNYQTLCKIFNPELVKLFKLKNYSLPYDYGVDMNDMLKKHTFGPEFENILRFSDRNSMSQSIEARMPFLSHKLADFLFTVPVEYKINEHWTKFLLRTSFADVLPSEIAWRRDKIAYETPYEEWMKNPMVKKDLIDTIDKIASTKFFAAEAQDIITKNYHKMSADFLWRIWVVGKLVYINQHGLQ